MPLLKAEAIVLRHVNYRDSDRMLTLLSPAYGRLDAKAPGVLKPKSALIASSELFAAGEYQLFEKGGRHTVTGFSLLESYYPLRAEYDRLKYGVYLLQLSEAVSVPGSPAQELYLLLRSALAYLAYSGDIPPEAVAAAFLMGFARAEGHQPQLNTCVRCGSSASLRWFLEDRAGGLVCANCVREGEAVSGQTLAFLRALQQGGFAAIESAQAPAMPRQALLWLRRFIEARTERRIPSAKLL